MDKKNTASEYSFHIVKRTAGTMIKYALLFVGFAGVLAAVAFLIVYPLWYLAVEQKAAYTIAVLAALAALPLVIFIYRLQRAIRGSRIDEFYAGFLRWIMLLLLLSSQIGYSLVTILLVELAGNSGTFDPLVMLTMLVSNGLAILSLVFFSLCRRHGQLAPFGSVLFATLFILLFSYWSAVFVSNGLFFLLFALLFAIFFLFFSLKITKIIREKKNEGRNKEIH